MLCSRKRIQKVNGKDEDYVENEKDTNPILCHLGLREAKRLESYLTRVLT